MIYFDNAEVNMPHTHSGHTEEFGYYPTTFGGGVGQGKSHCTRQIAQGYLQHL